MTISASSTAIRLFGSAILLLAASSCANLAPASHNPDEGGSPSLSSGLVMTSVEFKPGHPRSDESLASAVANRSFDLKALKRDEKIIKNYPRLKFDVIGYTDHHECTGVECKNLSAVRAKLVYQWLISRGVSAESLNPPAGRGSVMPLDIGETEEGRTRNRRVEISLSND